MRLISEDWPYLLPGMRRNVVAAYVLWLLWGTLGLHQLYLGRPGWAALYLLTFGLLGLGWLYDLFTLPEQVARCNARLGVAPRRARLRVPWWRRLWGAVWPRAGATLERERLMVALLEHARANEGLLTVTEGVLATGQPFGRVEAALRGMLQSGYVDVRNHPDTGTVQYVFPEFMRAGAGAAGSRPAGSLP